MANSTQLILFCFFFITTAATVSATDHIVGANKGWNPGVNYTLWANNQTFYVGDFISFRYQKTMYNVFEVNQTGYDNCTMDGVVGNWTSGKDFILLTEAKRYYFIGGNGQCLNGMKVTVLVHALPTNTTTSASNSSSSAHSICRNGRTFMGLGLRSDFAAVFGALLWSAIGYGLRSDFFWVC